MAGAVAICSPLGHTSVHPPVVMCADPYREEWNGRARKGVDMTGSMEHARDLAINARKLWSGGGVVAIVAGLVAIVGILIARGLVGVAILAPKGDGVWGNANTATYALLSAVAALVATGLVHVLLLATPRPIRFFAWIMVLLTLIAVVIPLTLIAGLDDRLGTAALNLVLGLVITALVSGVARTAATPRLDT